MKITRKLLIWSELLITFGSLTLATSQDCHAQTEPPPPGTYFSMQLTNLPPMPFDPLPDLDIYADPSAPAGIYLYDDRSIDYSSSATSLSTGGFATMSADEPAPPGDGGGTTNSIVPEIMLTRPSDGYTPCVTWTNFWLLVSNNSSGVTVTISNTLAGLQYVLLQKQTLTDPSWTTVQTLTATGPMTQCSPITPGTNTSLFFETKLTNNLAPVIITPPTNVVVATGSAATFRVVADGNPAVTYQWSLNGTNISGATTSAYNIGSAGAANAGLYTVIVSNAICTTTASAYLGLTWSQYLTNAISSSPAVNPVDGTIYIQLWVVS